MTDTSSRNPETREQSPSQSAKINTSTNDLDKYDLIIGRRGFKGYCSRKVLEFLQGWYPRYSSTKYKSNMLQQQIYPEFVSKKFKAYHKGSKGEFCLEEDESKIIAKLRKEMDHIKSKCIENSKSTSRSRKRERTEVSESTPQKRKDHSHYSGPKASTQGEEIALEGEDFLLQAYMDEIPLKPTGLGPSVSTSFRIPGFHPISSEYASLNSVHPNVSQAYMKDVFQWQDFESYAIPPSLGPDSGSPTASAILRSISSGVYVSPETVPENQHNEVCTFSSTTIDTAHAPSALTDKTPEDQHSHNPPCEMTQETSPQFRFSDDSVSDQNRQNKKSVDSSRCPEIDNAVVVKESPRGNPSSNVAIKAGRPKGANKKKLPKPKPNATPRFTGPSPISFQVLPPRRTPLLAPKPPSVVDMMLLTVKQLEDRAESLERENTNMWKRLQELELKYETMLSPANGKEEEETKIFQV